MDGHGASAAAERLVVASPVNMKIGIRGSVITTMAVTYHREPDHGDGSRGQDHSQQWRWANSR